jgi:hypothetical protein
MSKKPTKTTTDPLIEGAKRHFNAATEHVRKGCAEALITGLHLFGLHQKTAHEPRGFSVSRDTRTKGFDFACQEIGIPTRTAYRWMNACGNALLRATLIMDAEDLAENLPEPESDKWAKWEKALAEVAQGMSLNRLLLGAAKESTEDSRYSELLDADEEGRERATALLQGVAEGKYNLVQAVRALGSLEAYDQLRKEGGEKVRKDPVYLGYDPVSKRPTGLIPKAFVTLSNGFPHWEEYDDDARADMKTAWIEVIKAAPRELTELLRK